MKKLIFFLMICLLLASCGKKEEEKIVPEYPYEIKSEKVDMSAYDGVSSTDHNFRIIRLSELFNTIDMKSSGVFYLGRTNCGCCQDVCRYLNEVAREMGVTVYYIDVYDEKEPLTEKEAQDKLFDYLYEILGSDEEGEKLLLTPHVFSVVNGEFYGSQICFDGYDIDDHSSRKEIEEFKDSYRRIMEPFAK